MYLVGKDADGGDAAAPGAGDGALTALAPPDIEQIREDAARRAALDLATAALNASDGSTAAHSDDVDVITDGLCRLFGITGREHEDILAAARLHDIGKVAVPPEVLSKPGPLDDAEWAIMRRHTIVGQQILDAVPEMGEVAEIVRHSHERWDGEGYPDGISDEEIPLGSRIVACADAYHAVRSDRAYRKGRDAEAALEEICSCAGTQFDPDVTDALQLLAEELRTAPEPPAKPGRKSSHRTSRLAALLLILALGAGGSAVARFASPFTPEAEADQSLPAPAAASPFALPDLSDLPLFDLGAVRRGDGAAATNGRAPRRTRREEPPAPQRAAGEGRPDAGAPAAAAPSGTTDSAPPPATSGSTRDDGGAGGSHAAGSTRPSEPSSGGSGGGNGSPAGNGGGSGGGNPSGGGGGPAPAPDPPDPPDPPAPAPPSGHVPPGQVPGGNPGHGGLPPGNPSAPGHQPGGTPGHGGTPPGHGGTPPGQAQR